MAASNIMSPSRLGLRHVVEHPLTDPSPWREYMRDAYVDAADVDGHRVTYQVVEKPDWSLVDVVVRADVAAHAAAAILRKMADRIEHDTVPLALQEVISLGRSDLGEVTRYLDRHCEYLRMARRHHEALPLPRFSPGNVPVEL